MMPRTFYHSATGMIDTSVRAGSEAQMALLTRQMVLQGFGFVDGDADPETHWVSAGRIEPRPAVALPAEHTVAAGAEWAVGDVPAGTIVTDAPGGTLGVVGGPLVREWAVPGSYRMMLSPPWPWLASECRVTVT